jgi:hypothetical protein
VGFLVFLADINSAATPLLTPNATDGIFHPPLCHALPQVEGDAVTLDTLPSLTCSSVPSFSHSLLAPPKGFCSFMLPFPLSLVLRLAGVALLYLCTF